MVRVLFIMLCLIPAIIEASSFSMEIEVTPPPLHLDNPPTVTVVPNLEEYVYVIPNVSGIYFYDGHWYRYYRGHWFRSAFYEGPWVYVSVANIPVILIDIHTHYPVTVVQYRIHYYELSRNLRYWAHSRHWHSHDWYRCGWDRPDRRVKFEVSERDNRAYLYRPAPVERYNRPPQKHNHDYNRDVIISNPKTGHYQYSEGYRIGAYNYQHPAVSSQRQGIGHGKTLR